MKKSLVLLECLDIVKVIKMSGVQQRLNLKRTPIDTWSLREQLNLASAVLKSGDQNWVTVSRMMKQLAEPGRPNDWINQKTCARYCR